MGLKDLLGEELYNQVSEKLGDTKIDVVSDGSWIPKEKFNSLNETKKDLETQLKTATDTIADLKKNNGDNEGLQTTIKEHEETIKTLKADSESKIRNITLDNAIQLALTNGKARHVDLLVGKFDREKLKIKEDGTVEGLDGQLKGLKESYKDLFEQPLSGNPPHNGGQSTQPGEKQLGADIAAQRNATPTNQNQNNPWN